VDITIDEKGVAATSPEDVPMRAFALSRPPGHHNACTAELEQDYPLEDGTSANWVWACHGGCLLPNIPIDHAKAFIDAVKEYKS
jgi:hypothetical protein